MRPKTVTGGVMQATLLDTGFMVKVLLLLRTGVFVMEQVFYYLIWVTNRYGNRPTELIKSHSFFGVRYMMLL